MGLKKRIPPLTKFQREYRKAVDRAYKAAIKAEKKVAKSNPNNEELEFIVTKGRHNRGQIITFQGKQLKIIRALPRDDWDKVKGHYKYEAREIKSNPQETIKQGEWTPAHAVRIRKGRLEIMR